MFQITQLSAGPSPSSQRTYLPYQSLSWKISDRAIFTQYKSYALELRVRVHRAIAVAFSYTAVFWGVSEV
jgi:hypothetical protein